MADPFADKAWLQRTYHRLAESGVEIPPAELAVTLRGFFLEIQDQLAKHGLWWSLDFLVSRAVDPVTLRLVKNLSRTRGQASWRDFVDVFLALGEKYDCADTTSDV